MPKRLLHKGAPHVISNQDLDLPRKDLIQDYADDGGKLTNEQSLSFIRESTITVEVHADRV